MIKGRRSVPATLTNNFRTSYIIKFEYNCMHMRLRETYIFAIVITLLFPLLINAQVNVNKVDASFNTANQEGIIYSLPRTLIKIDVTVEQKELLAGPLRNYAQEYLGITNYISSNSNEYRIKDIRLSTISEPDPGHYYFVSLGEKTSREAWQTILNFNGKGMITSTSTSSNDDGVEAMAITRSMSRDEVMDIFRHYADLNIYAKVDTIVRTINIDTITIEDYTFRTTMTAKPLEVKAAEVAGMIKKIREGRYNLLTGYQEVNYSEGALKFMNEELLNMEQEYLRLFTGAAVTSYLTYTFTYLPTEASIGNNITVFALSKTEGISKGGGDQVSVNITLSGNTANISASNNGTGNGIYYRLPEEAEVKILYQGKTAAQDRVAISQFGKLGVLPASASNVEFDGKTGGLKSVKFQE